MIFQIIIRTIWEKSPGNRAFSLIEMLVVLSIIAVTACIVSPYAGHSFASMKVRQAALTLAEHIRYAQALAVDNNVPTRLSIDMERQRYQLEIASDCIGIDYVVAPGVSGQYIGLPDGVWFDDTEFSIAPDGNDRTLLFTPTGLWSLGRIWVTDGVKKYLIDIKAGMGNVEVSPLETGERVPMKDGYENLLNQPL